MDVMIRKASREDAPGISAILRELGWFSQFTQEPVLDSEKRVCDMLALDQKDDSHSVFVAEGDDSRIMGYTSVHWLPYLLLPGPEGYVSELFICEADRGKGIGTLLLEAVASEAHKRGCCRLMLINMRKRESYHREFYIKKGWIEREGAANFILEL